MPRSRRLLTALTLAALLAPAAAAQDDAKTAAEAAEKLRPDLQKKLAAGTDAQKRLRLDTFEAAGDAVKVTGVYLDTPAAKTDDPVPFDQTTDDLIKSVRETLKLPNLKFDVKGVTRVAPDKHPHVALQAAANAKGGAADHLFATDSAFGPGGELLISGFRDAAAGEWLDADGAAALAKHPAGTKKVTLALAKLDKWPLAVAEIRKTLSGSKEVGFRRLRADRAFVSYEGGAPKVTVTGVGLEAEKVGDITDTLKGLWPDVLKAIKVTPDFVGGLADPSKDIQAAVTTKRALDGLRVDPGSEFGPAGEFKLAGLRPDLTADQKKELGAVYLGVLKALAAKGGAADRYKLLEASPVSADGMRPIPVNALRDDLRAWATAYRDDVRLRLYFATDLTAVGAKRHVAPEYGGGLVLVYQIADADDAPAVEARFARLFAEHFPKGLPDIKVTGEASRTKEPLLPGLTAELRRIVSADPKEWYGVLIARGYFDAAGRYTLAGAVDTKEQTAKLDALLKRLAADDKWKRTYFTSETGDDLPPNPVALAVVSMAEMLDKVQRVTPAYPVFNGLRIEKVGYDARANLVFEAVAAGPVAPEAVDKLADLLVDAKSPFKSRVIRPEQERPRVRIAPVAGPPYANEQVANFSLAYGARLLGNAGATAADRAAAKAWLDAALLNYPTEAAVWFLSAQYNYLYGDADRARRAGGAPRPVPDDRAGGGAGVQRPGAAEAAVRGREGLPGHGAQRDGRAVAEVLPRGQGRSPAPDAGRGEVRPALVTQGLTTLATDSRLRG